MNRRRFLAASAVAAGAAVPAGAWAVARGDEAAREETLQARRLRVPPDGLIRVAFAIGEA